jgi:hypothetical protein
MTASRLGSALRNERAAAPLREHLESMVSSSVEPSSWGSVESDFLAAMQALDDFVTSGEASEGVRQNGKGDYFNEVLRLVLEGAAGVRLDARHSVPGLIFPKHNLDLTYPATGPGDLSTVAEVMVEAKMLGTPQHPGNETTQGIEGRRGSADLLKRCKEAGFKSIDLKAAFGMVQSERGERQQRGVDGDLTTWLRAVRPKSYLALAVRVISEQDAVAVVAMADNMTRVMDGVGLFMYRAVGYDKCNLNPAKYEAVPVPPTLQMGRVIYRIGLDLRAAKSRNIIVAPDLPSLKAERSEGRAAEGS